MTGVRAAPKRRREGGWVEQQNVLLYRAGTIIMRIVIRLWSGGIYSYGVEHVPTTHGVFLIANHTSFADPFAVTIGLNGRLLRGPGKKELFQHPFLGRLMRNLGIFPLDRNRLDAASVRTMVELYRAGTVIELYPEGVRSETGVLQPFDRDFTRLVLRLKAPLVPVGIAGAYEMMPVGVSIPRRHSPIVVVFGEEFQLSEFYASRPTEETVEAATFVLEHRVAAMMAEAELRLHALTST